MRMYTLHFGQGREHTTALYDQAKGNMPYNFTGWDNGNGYVPHANCENTQIVSHKEIFNRYGVKGGHGEYCVEVWTHDIGSVAFSCQLHTGGYGDTLGNGHDVRAFYLKFDFMYTQTNQGTVIVLQRTKSNDGSEDLTLELINGYLSVYGSEHVTQPDTDPPTYREESWIPRSDGRQGSIYLEPNKWHEIQIFVNPYQGWDISKVGPNPIGLGYYEVDSFVPFFQAYELDPQSIPTIDGSETGSGEDGYPLQLDTWPTNGHPQFPNTMISGHNQAAWPPENYASGQYFYGENLGLIYVWVNGKLDIQHTTNMSNERSGWGGSSSQQAVFLGYNISNSDADNPLSGRFFYDSIVMNDIRNPSGSYPSKIFDPLFSSHASLEWNPGYDLKFTAMEINPTYWDHDNAGIPGGRKHDTWMPEYPRGALVPSGDPYFVPAPNRYGSSTDSMIPHGTKLTVIHTDWNGEEQDYTASKGNRTLYPDYNVDYTYQYVQPNESNPLSVNQDDPRLSSSTSGNKVLFYLKRPPAASGKQPLAGGYGMGGVKDYVPNIDTNLGEIVLPPIYRIWTCIQDQTMGASEPIDHQHHLIRVPSGSSEYVDYISDNQCPGDRTYRAYHNGTGTIPNGYSMSDWPYNPVTGDPWTWDDLEELQIGVYHGTHLEFNTGIVYTIYLVVEHASSVNSEIGILGDNLLEFPIADDIPFSIQQKTMHHPGWKFYELGNNYLYYNRWDISPQFVTSRSERQTSDGQAIISGVQYSGSIEFDYYVRYLNGDIIQGANYSDFDEHFDEVWVYTISGIAPSTPIRRPMRGEVIVDVDDNYFTFLGYPVLQWNDKKYPTDNNLSPLSQYPYVLYDYNTLYVVPLHLYNTATLLDPDAMSEAFISPNTKPSIIGGQWTINKQVNSFNFKIDPDSYFHPFSPSSVANHAATHPNESLDYTFPASRSGHDYYFQAPDLASGSVMQTIHLTDKFGIPESAIDNELYQAYIGLYQTTANQTVNDAGEGRFDFYDGNPSIDTFISGYTFGLDATVGWHLNDATVLVPSGTRQVRFMFNAIRNTAGPKSPGSTLGGTSNFASFDEPFFILSTSSGYVKSAYHPADTNQNSRIGYDELADYTTSWQTGTLPSGIAKNYLTKAEQIWQSGVSTFFNDPSGGLYYDADDAQNPYNWMGSGYI